MPINNDYFKNRQQNNDSKNSGNNNGNNNGGGSNYEPPFEPPEFFNKLGNLGNGAYIAIAIVILLVLAKPFVIINSGEVGIKVTTGKYETEPLQPGFHIYIPVIQKVITVDTKVRLINYKSLEDMSGMGQGIKINPAITILDA
jgi:hypothetical protein